jgi:O-antigen/teichoic acid export membrane protein
MFENKIKTAKTLLLEPLYRNTLAMIVNSALLPAFGLLFWIVAAQTISVSDLGLVTAVISIGSLILSLSRFGMDESLMRFLPEHADKNELYSLVMTVTLALAVLISIVFVLNVGWIAPSLVFLQRTDFFLAFIFLIIVSSVFTSQNSAIMSQRSADRLVIQNLLLGLRVPLLFLTGFLGMISVFYSICIAYLLSLFYGRYLLFKGGISTKIRIGLQPIKKIMAFSLGNYSANILYSIPYSVMPLLIINVLGPKENAYYFMAYNVVYILYTIPVAISTTLFVEGSNNCPLRETTLKSIKFAYLLIVPATILAIVFGDRLLLIFSKEYSAQSIMILQLLALSSLFRTMVSIYVSVKRVQKKTNIINMLYAISFILLITGGYFMMQLYGINGLGYAWLMNDVFIFAIVLLIIKYVEKWV